MIKCNVCNIEKYTEKFETLPSGNKRKMCRECRSNQVKDYYKSNRVGILAQKRIHQKTTREDMYVYTRSLKRRYGKLKNKSKYLMLGFDISLEQYENLIIKPCYYCDTITYGKEAGVGLDRIDSNKGYLLSNVVQCCATCNLIKLDSSIDELLEKLPKMINKLKTLKGI